MYEELERLLAQLTIGKIPPVQALLKLRQLILPRAIWSSLTLEGLAFSLAEINTIVDTLESKSSQTVTPLSPETEPIKRWYRAFILIFTHAEHSDPLSIELISEMQSTLQKDSKEKQMSMTSSPLLSSLLLSWNERKNTQKHPIEGAAWWLCEMARLRPLQEENDTTSRLIASFLLVRDGFPPLLFGQEQREAYIEALKTSLKGELSSLTRFLIETSSLGVEELLSAERSTEPLSAARLGNAIASRQKELWQLLQKNPAEDPLLLEERSREVNNLSSWIDYVLGRVETAAKGPLYHLRRAPVRSDWAIRLLGGLYHPLYIGQGAALSIRVAPHREVFLPARPMRFPAVEMALTVFVVATKASLQLIVSSPQASAIREARRRVRKGGPTRPTGLSSLPMPSTEEITQARLDFHGPPAASDWPRVETEAWILSWLERLIQGYEKEIVRLNNLEKSPETEKDESKE